MTDHKNVDMSLEDLKAVQDAGMMRRAADSAMIQTMMNINESMVTIKMDLAEVKGDVKTLLPTVTKHEDILFGDAKQAGESGLVSKVSKMEYNLKSIQSIGSGAWAVIMILINVVVISTWEWIKERVKKGGG